MNPRSCSASVFKMKSKYIVIACLLAISYSKRISLSRVRRTVGGTAVEPGQFSWTAFVYNLDGNAKCGGAILTQDWILTAAHCVYDAGKDRVGVMAGTIEVLGENPFAPQRRISSFYQVHSQFQKDTVAYDIALVKLAKPLESNALITAIGLPEEDSELPGFGTISGFGKDGPIDKSSYKMNIITALIIDGETCNKARQKRASEEKYKHIEVDSASNICIECPADQRTCIGDSGSPLVARSKNNQAVLVGILSNGPKACHPEGTTSVFVKVSHVVDWITSTMSEGGC